MVALNESFLTGSPQSSPTGTRPVVDNLYQGMTLDSVTGLYYARNRNYSPSLGRWINQDPAGYINGANTYQFVGFNPVNRADPLGESFWGWVGTGAVIGGLIAVQFVPGVDIVVDVGGTITVTGIGATAGGVGAGAVIGGTAGALAHQASITNPFKGKPGSTSSTQSTCGKPKQDRRYGPDGFPETDVDRDHDHGQGQPHAHDWGRPPGGGKPTNNDRGPGRPVLPSDPQPSVSGN